MIQTDIHYEITDTYGSVAGSYFSGVLVRYTSDCDQVIVGMYFC